MQPLSQRGVLPRDFNYFLTDYSSPERTHRGDLRSSEIRDILSNSFVDVLDLKLPLNFDLALLIALQELHELFGVARTVDLWQLA